MGTRSEDYWGRTAPYPPPGQLGSVDSTAIRHLAFLAEVSRLLGTSLDYQRTVTEAVRVLVPGFADVCSVFVDELGQRTRVAEAGLDADSESAMHELRDLPIPAVLASLFEKALRTGHALLVEDYDALVHQQPGVDDAYAAAIERLGVTAGIVAPVFVRGESAGALTLGMLKRTGRRFQASDVHFAEELAHRVGLAIDNARLYRSAETARRALEERESALVEERRIFETLYRIGASLATELDERKLMQRVTDEATALTGATSGAFCFNLGVDEAASCTPYAVAGAPLQAFADFPFLPIFGAFRDESLVRCDDVRMDPRFTSSPTPEELVRVVSYLAVPIITRSGEVLGGLFFAHSEPGRFTKEHERLVLGIAGQASVALENARLYAQLRASEAKARDAYRAARDAERRKDEFLAMLGHELRNPLAPIVTALELMRMRGATGREAQIIERQIGHLVRLVDDLLDVSRITRGKIELKRQRIEIADVVARALEIAGPLIQRRSHHLEVDVALGLPVFGDPTRLAQIVSNLLTNAAKYTDRGGHIEVRGRLENETVVLSVRDDGTGIEPSFLPRIFEPFVQSPQASDRAQGGLGIGLTLVRSLLALHGGRVEARSQGPGMGSELVIHLPRAAAAGAASGRPRCSSDPEAEARTPLRVLVVDDNYDAATMISEGLRELGHEVSAAEDGPTALHLAKTFRPDIAVLDIGLPQMDGYELARRLRCLDPAPASLIAVTGYGQPEDRARGLAAGFDAHLVKPVELAALKEAILAVHPSARRRINESRDSCCPSREEACRGARAAPR
jgi:signal transduction histidine kinase/CheY-like chemotaxis protein